MGYKIIGDDNFLSVAPVINHYDYRYGVDADESGIISSVLDISGPGNILLRRYWDAHTWLDADSIRLEDPVSNISNLYRARPVGYENVIGGNPFGFYFIGKINDKGFVPPDTMAVAPMYIQHDQVPQCTTFCSLDIANRRSVFRISFSSGVITLQSVGNSGSIPHNEFFFMKWLYYGKVMDIVTHTVNNITQKNKAAAADNGSFDTVAPLACYPMSKTGGGLKGAFHTKLNLLIDYTGFTEEEIDGKDARVLEILRADSEYNAINI